MDSLYLRVYPDPVLRKKTQPVVLFDGEFKNLVTDLVRLMDEHDGVGFAAPQAGVPLKLAVVFYQGELYVLANPLLVSSEGEQDGEEGCLSFPGIFGEIKRPMRVVVRHQDIDGNERETVGEGLLARAFLHEMDHLEGKLLIDFFSPLKRNLAKKKLLKEDKERKAART